MLNTALGTAIKDACGQEYRVENYSFEDDQARRRFWLGTNKPSGEYRLYELARVLKAVGVKDVPQRLTARSVYRPEMLIKPLVEYLQKPVMTADTSSLREAVARVTRAFYVGKLRPYSLEEVAYWPSKSAGAPTFSKKRDVVKESYAAARKILRGMAPPPVTVYHRGKNEEVVRPVFGYPFAMSLLESRFFEPYQQALVDHHNPCVWGKSHVEIAGGVNEVRWRSDIILEMDYSHFDGSISGRLLNHAFDIIENCFVLDKADKRTFDLVRNYFITCPILLPSGEVVIGKRHGVPSGSMFTQIVDSIVSAIAVEYLRIRTNTRISRYYILGDDNIIGIVGRAPELSRVADVLKELGLTINTDKSRYVQCREGHRIHFLGHYADSATRKRDRKESWEKLLCPERVDNRFFSDSKEERKQAYIERLMAYAEDNADIYSDCLKAVYFVESGMMLRFIPKEWVYRLSKVDEERERWDVSFQRFTAKLRARGENVIYGRLVTPFS